MSEPGGEDWTLERKTQVRVPSSGTMDALRQRQTHGMVAGCGGSSVLSKKAGILLLVSQQPLGV